MGSDDITDMIRDEERRLELRGSAQRFGESDEVYLERLQELPTPARVEGEEQP